MKSKLQQRTRRNEHLKTPRVSVHALTEFMFCHRAGLITTEQEVPEYNEPVGRKLGFTPRWTRRQLTRSIRRAIATWVLYTAGIGVLLFTAMLISTAFSTWATILVGVVSLGWWPQLPKRWLQSAAVIAHLAWQWVRAVTAPGRTPDPGHRQSLEVNWWELLNDGFESVAYREPLVDGRMNLVGRPWRVLRKGNLRIPVFYMKHGSKLRRQHAVRLAAYCHLLKTCEGAESPYGIVIRSDHSGSTIPVGSHQRHLLRQSLDQAQRVLGNAQRGATPNVDRLSKCKACPHGKPIVHRQGETESQSNGLILPVLGGVGADGRIYHSPCGDRFRWLPPHQRIVEKQIHVRRCN